MLMTVSARYSAATLARALAELEADQERLEIALAQRSRVTPADIHRLIAERRELGPMGALEIGLVDEMQVVL